MMVIPVMFNAAMCALNVAIYAEYGNPINLFAAVFCGILALFCMMMALND